MPSKNMAPKVDEKLYENYRSYCKQQGFIIYRQLEVFMEEKLKKDGSNKKE